MVGSEAAAFERTAEYDGRKRIFLGGTQEGFALALAALFVEGCGGLAAIFGWRGWFPSARLLNLMVTDEPQGQIGGIDWCARVRGIFYPRRFGNLTYKFVSVFTKEDCLIREPLPPDAACRALPPIRQLDQRCPFSFLEPPPRHLWVSAVLISRSPWDSKFDLELGVHIYEFLKAIPHFPVHMGFDPLAQVNGAEEEVDDDENRDPVLWMQSIVNFFYYNIRRRPPRVPMFEEALQVGKEI